LGDAVAYLVPVGAGRFELYSEPPEDAAGTARNANGFWRRQAECLHARWRDAVLIARGTDPAASWFARARDGAVSRVVESIAEQRTLWLLRRVTSASLVYPSTLSDASAAAVRDRLLAHARRHHGRWLMVDAAAVALTAVLILLPGPNVIGYYFAFRVLGHYFSWRGACQGLDRTTWRLMAEPALAELGLLAHLPRDERAARVHALAAELHLPRLAAFFDRTTAPIR
jgi:hypothetical protein